MAQERESWGGKASRESLLEALAGASGLPGGWSEALFLIGSLPHGLLGAAEPVRKPLGWGFRAARAASGSKNLGDGRPPSFAMSPPFPGGRSFAPPAVAE